MGSRKASKLDRGNSANSSKKRIPLWARVTSPGFNEDPPTKAAAVAEWWGKRNGFSMTSDRLWINLTSIFSDSSKGKRREGMRFNEKLFPIPGSPAIKILCFPAAATSKATHAFGFFKINSMVFWASSNFFWSILNSLSCKFISWWIRTEFCLCFIIFLSFNQSFKFL